MSFPSCRVCLVAVLALVCFVSSWCAHPVSASSVVALAMFASHGCAGAATFASISISALSGSFISDACVTLPGGAASWPIFNWEGSNRWIISQYTSCAQTGNSFATTTGISGDFGCYNLATGSLVIDSTSSAASKVGTTLTSPPMTSNEIVVNDPSYSIPSYATFGFAYWKDDACQYGSSHGVASDQPSCWGTASTSTQVKAYWTAVCASRSASSAWTISVWQPSASASSYSRCTAKVTPDNVMTGVGLQCVALPPAGSVVIDCTILTPRAYINYLPPLDVCAGVNCGAHGSCSGGTCSCTGGYSGSTCSTAPVDPCAAVNCGTHGNCSSGMCICTGGYSGSTCTTAPATDPCASVSCGAHGSCSSGTCTCTGGYSGSTCTTAPIVDPCAGISCGAYGSCTGGTCTCTSGYSGSTCTTAPAASSGSSYAACAVPNSNCGVGSSHTDGVFCCPAAAGGFSTSTVNGVETATCTGAGSCTGSTAGGSTSGAATLVAHIGALLFALATMATQLTSKHL